jgi:O-antigen ligase
MNPLSLNLLKGPMRRSVWLLTLCVVVSAWVGVAHAAAPAEGPDVFDVESFLGEGTRLFLYGVFALGLCIVSVWVPDAPLLAFLFSMSLVQFSGLRVALMVMQCALVLLRTGAPRTLVPSWPLSLFLLCLAASGSWALEPHDSFLGELAGIKATLLQVPLALAVLATLRSRLTTMNRLLAALVCGAVPGCIRTIQNALAGERFLGDQDEYYMGFIPPDIFTTILVISGVFLMFCLTSSQTSRRMKALAGVVLPLFCVALVLSGIRSGWMGFGLASLFLLLRTRSVLALGCVMLVLSLVALLGFSGVTGLNLDEKLSARMSENSMHSGTARLEFWEVAAQGFAQRPVLGIGWGCFPGFAEDHTMGNRWATHNIFVRVACELGLVGCLFFLAWITGTCLSVRGSPLANLAMALMLGVLVQGLFLDLFLGSQFWLFLGLCEGVRASGSPRLGESLELPRSLYGAPGAPTGA